MCLFNYLCSYAFIDLFIYGFNGSQVDLRETRSEAYPGHPGLHVGGPEEEAFGPLTSTARGLDGSDRLGAEEPRCFPALPGAVGLLSCWLAICQLAYRKVGV